MTRRDANITRVVTVPSWLEAAWQAAGSSARAIPAEKPLDTPLTPADLNATVLHLTGMTSEQVTGLGLTPTGRVIEEVF